MHASIVITIYAVLVGGGGLAGYLRAKSAPSLILGGLSCLALLAAARAIQTEQAWGLPLALALTLFLLVFFSVRYFKSSPRAFMPGGLIAVLSLLTLVGIVLTKK